MTEENTQNTPTPVTDWKQRELGALWRREGKNQNFLSGMIRVGDPLGADSVKEIKVVVFTNKGKAKNERAPDFIIYQEMSGRVYKKYVEVKSGNSPLSKREEEFKQQHPHSYIELRVSGDSRFHNFKDEVRSMISPQEWREFLQI